VARTDIVVLGAGIVGTSIALSLVKRGLSVTLVDRGEPGRGTSLRQFRHQITPLRPRSGRG
jgi:D-amino-acid dehydrogenase